MRLYGGYSLRRSFKDYGWAVAVAVSVVALVFAWQIANPVEEAGDALIDVVRSPASVRCLEGWTTTVGTDPDGQIKMRVCTSPDKRYVITVRENQVPLGFDGQFGQFLTPDEAAGMLR